MQFPRGCFFYIWFSKKQLTKTFRDTNISSNGLTYPQGKHGDSLWCNLSDRICHGQHKGGWKTRDFVVKWALFFAIHRQVYFLISFEKSDYSALSIHTPQKLWGFGYHFSSKYIFLILSSHTQLFYLSDTTHLVTQQKTQLVSALFQWIFHP